MAKTRRVDIPVSSSTTLWSDNRRHDPQPQLVQINSTTGSPRNFYKGVTVCICIYRIPPYCHIQYIFIYTRTYGSIHISACTHTLTEEIRIHALGINVLGTRDFL